MGDRRGQREGQEGGTTWNRRGRGGWEGQEEDEWGRRGNARGRRRELEGEEGKRKVREDGGNGRGRMGEREGEGGGTGVGDGGTRGGGWVAGGEVGERERRRERMGSTEVGEWGGVRLGLH